MKKAFKISAMILLLCVIALLIAVITIHKDKTFVKKCYKNNQDIFDSLATTFSKCYEPSLKYIRYDYDTDTITTHYADKEISYDNDIDLLKKSLNELQQEYQDVADYKVFSSVSSYYDDSGNMLMYFIVKNATINSGKEDKIRHFYLVYIDESYHGCGSDLSIDKFGINTEPFSDNWYYYSADTPIG